MLTEEYSNIYQEYHQARSHHNGNHFATRHTDPHIVHDCLHNCSCLYIQTVVEEECLAMEVDLLEEVVEVEDLHILHNSKLVVVVVDLHILLHQ